MLPKTHIVLGIIFSAILYIFMHITLIEAGIIFFASVLIDIDHYIFYVIKKRDLNLKKAYKWHVNYKTKKSFLQIFHTFEFIVFLVILCNFWKIFIFVLIGILYHSIMDLIDYFYKEREDYFYAREFFIIRYLLTDKKIYV